MTRETNAVFSPCRKWRYRLWRWWDRALPHATFLMMNPSTADEVENDPTVERCERRVMEWNNNGVALAAALSGQTTQFGGVEVVNVFAWRETDSSLLSKLVRDDIDIIGPENDQAILHACKGAALVVCGWGAVGHHLLRRGVLMRSTLLNHGVKPHAFKINADGSPKHPLYVGYQTMPKEWV